jgi:CubicO group peptidase (beta-lactamase class C family)
MTNNEARLAAGVESALNAGIADGKIVGAATRVMLHGHLVFAGAAGYADREAGVPLTDDMIFRLASMTKAPVAATALALVERGKLSLDDPVSRFLPSFRPRLKDGTVPDILIRQLMTHTSGLTYGFVQRADHPYHRAQISDGMDQPGLSMEENLRRIASVPLEFAPGTGWGYSVSIDVLGAAIAEANATTLADAVREYVTGPLGMTDTGFAAPDRARLVTPYADGPDVPVRMGEPHRVRRPEDPETYLIMSPARVFDARSFQSGGAGMNGTTADYMRFLEALRLDGGPILKPETVAMAVRNHIGALPREPQDAGLRNSLFGGMVQDPVAATTPQSAGTLTFGGAWGHSGFMDKARGLSVVTLTNTSVAGVSGTFPTTMRDAIYGALAG